MGVYIKGMEMPPNCLVCPLGWTKCSNVSVNKRSDDCPLVPVPPHGRLIDADAFEEHIMQNWDESDHWIALHLDARPTILEAEEGE